MSEISNRNGKVFCYAFVALAVLALTMSNAALAADTRRLELKDLPNLVGTSELVQASDVAISPDGKWVAYTVTTKSLPAEETKQRLWVQAFEGGEATQIGPQDADNSGPNWSPDSSKLLFNTASKEHSSLAIWNVLSKTIRPIDVSVRQAPKWLPDSTRFLVGLSHGAAASKPSKSESKPPAPIVFTASDTNRRLPDGHYIGVVPQSGNTEPLDFATVDAGTGTVKTVVTDIDPNILEYEISPDGTKLAYTVTKGLFEYDPNNRNVFDIKVVDLLNGSSFLAATDLMGREFSPAWSHNGKMLAIIGGTLRDDESSPPPGSLWADRPSYCYVVDLKRPGTLRSVGPRIVWREFPPTWSDDDASLFAVTSRKNGGQPREMVKLTLANGTVQTIGKLPVDFDVSIIEPPKSNRGDIYIMGSDRSGERWGVFSFNLRSQEFKPVSRSDKHAIGTLSVSDAGTRVAYLTVGSSEPNNIRVSDAGGEAHRLTHLDLSAEQQQKIGQTREISWEFNGKTRYGTVWLPSNYQEGRRYPTILDVYPTNQGAETLNFFRGDPFATDGLIWQALLANGYVVFWPDFDFRVGEGPHEIAAQIIPALDKIVEVGIADSNGLGVYGRSWGGYSTYSLITETRRFKAAIAASGYSNSFTVIGELDDNSSAFCLGLIEGDLAGASPWQNRDLYIKTSPYFNFDKVTTPVMIQYGAQDTTFAWTSKEAFVALRRLGKTATLLGYLDDGHGVGKAENKVDFTNRALDWFDRYLKSSEQAASASIN